MAVRINESNQITIDVFYLFIGEWLMVDGLARGQVQALIVECEFITIFSVMPTKNNDEVGRKKEKVKLGLECQLVIGYYVIFFSLLFPFLFLSSLTKLLIISVSSSSLSSAFCHLPVQAHHCCSLQSIIRRCQ